MKPSLDTSRDLLVSMDESPSFDESLELEQDLPFFRLGAYFFLFLSNRKSKFDAFVNLFSAFACFLSSDNDKLSVDLLNPEILFILLILSSVPEHAFLGPTLILFVIFKPLMLKFGQL